MLLGFEIWVTYCALLAVVIARILSGGGRG